MRQRIRAALVDLALVLGWVAVVSAVVVTLALSGAGPRLPPLQLNLVVGAAMVLPAIGWLTLTEGGRYGASPGKQWLGLRVLRTDGDGLGRPRALVRNLAKLGLPWAIGHAAVVALLTTPAPAGADVWILLGIAVLLPVAYLVAAFLEGGRTPYDLLASSRVVTAATGRRVAED
ncbi:MAG: RDD family protein [Propionicimonas sp.]